MQLTLKELINRVSWAKIEEKIFTIYPEEADSLHYYKRLYWTLSNLKAEENPTAQTIELELLSEDEEIYYDELDDDYDGYDEEYDEEFSLTIEGWKKFLGYFVSGALLEEIDEAEVIAHTFVEATYGGFKQAELHNETDD